MNFSDERRLNYTVFQLTETRRKIQNVFKDSDEQGNANYDCIDFIADSNTLRKVCGALSTWKKKGNIAINFAIVSMVELLDEVYHILENASEKGKLSKADAENVVGKIEKVIDILNPEYFDSNHIR